MDFFPTILNLAKAEIPQDRTLDGADIRGLLNGKQERVTDVVYFYDSDRLHAIRKGPWKAHFMTHASYTPEAPAPHDPPLLYNVETDPSERFELGKEHPEVIEDLKKEYEKHKAGIKPVPPLLDAVISVN